MPRQILEAGWSIKMMLALGWPNMVPRSVNLGILRPDGFLFCLRASRSVKSFVWKCVSCQSNVGKVCLSWGYAETLERWALICLVFYGEGEISFGNYRYRSFRRLEHGPRHRSLCFFFHTIVSVLVDVKYGRKWTVWFSMPNDTI